MSMTSYSGVQAFAPIGDYASPLWLVVLFPGICAQGAANLDYVFSGFMIVPSATVDRLRQ